MYIVLGLFTHWEIWTSQTTYGKKCIAKTIPLPKPDGVFCCFPKNHGISSHWWFGDLKEPCEKQGQTPPNFGGSNDS